MKEIKEIQESKIKQIKDIEEMKETKKAVLCLLQGVPFHRDPEFLGP